MPWISKNEYLTDAEMQNNADIIIAYYQSIGLDNATIAGILGNMQAESTLSPILEERGGGGGYGLVQWTPKSDLISACNTLGLTDYTSGDTQIQVVIAEIKGTPASIRQWYTTSAYISKYYNSGATSDMIGITAEQFLSNSMGWTADKLALMFMAGYERPSYNPDTNHTSKRQENALNWYDYIDGGVVPPGVDYLATIAPFIKTVFTITSEWWEERSYYHKGLDIATGSNDNVYSMFNGYVYLKSYDADGFGNYIIIKDNETGIASLYGHLKEVLVSEGDNVTKGQLVAIEGTTGHSTGIHLHLELQDLSNRDWIFGANKDDYLNPAEFMGIPNQLGIKAYYKTGTTPPKPTPTTKNNTKKWFFNNLNKVIIKF